MDGAIEVDLQPYIRSRTIDLLRGGVVLRAIGEAQPAGPSREAILQTSSVVAGIMRAIGADPSSEGINEDGSLTWDGEVVVTKGLGETAEHAAIAYAGSLAFVAALIGVLAINANMGHTRASRHVTGVLDVAVNVLRQMMNDIGRVDLVFQEISLMRMMSESAVSQTAQC